MQPPLERLNFCGAHGGQLSVVLSAISRQLSALALWSAVRRGGPHSRARWGKLGAGPALQVPGFGGFLLTPDS